jgi:hypothetical protein
MRDLTLQFTETAQEEVDRLVMELGLVPLAQTINQNRQDLPEELQKELGQLMGIILDMFSADLPLPNGDPEDTLRIVSREINLGRLLKERGIFRFYNLLDQEVYFDPDTGEQVDEPKGSVSLSLCQTLNNPITGQPFANDTEFIGWFCEEAHVSRSLLFRRIMAIRRMVKTLGFDIEEAFNIMVSKPYAIEETIRMIADWDKENLKNVDPDVLVEIAKKVRPGQAAEYELLAAQAGEDPDSLDFLISQSKPVLADLLREVADHERSKDAMDTVRHDILRIPEISYRWDPDGDFLVVTIITKSIDEDGGEYVKEILHVPFIPDLVAKVPREIKNDLIKRLPIKNRDELD